MVFTMYIYYHVLSLHVEALIRFASPGSREGLAPPAPHVWGRTPRVTSDQLGRPECVGGLMRRFLGYRLISGQIRAVLQSVLSRVVGLWKAVTLHPNPAWFPYFGHQVWTNGFPTDIQTPKKQGEASFLP